MVLAWKKKTVFTALILATLMITLIPILTPKIQVNAQDGTEIVVLPAENTFYANETLPGSTFNVTATVLNVTDLQCWQIKLTWNSSLLNYLGIRLPADHVFSEAGRAMITPPPIVGPGYVMWGCTYINIPYWTFNGTGTLCQIELEILKPPSLPPVTCDLSLVNLGIDTFLTDGAQHDIIFTVEDGTFTYEDHLEVSISPTSETVYFGENVTFTATASDGAEPYRYQWYFKYPNGTQTEFTEAENETSWTCPYITETGFHWVTVSVTDSVGLQINASAKVEIYGLSITIDPQYPTVDVGGTVTFTATPSGGVPPYKMQWYRNSTEIAAVENETVVPFTFNTVGIEYVKVVVTDSELNTKDSINNKVTVLPPSTTMVKVVPETATFYTDMTIVGDKVTFNLTVQDVNELETWQVNLTWDPTLLNFSDIRLPSDHVFAGAAAAGKSLFTPPPLFGIGSVSWGCTYTNTPPYWTFNGTGTLCQVELEIIRYPTYPESSCIMALTEKYSDTFLLKMLGESIPFSIENATYTYVLVECVTHTVLEDYTVTTCSNATIHSDTVFPSIDDKTIEFNIHGETGTRAYVNVTIPKTLLIAIDGPPPPWIIYLNDTDVTTEATITDTADYTYVYLEFTFGSTQTVKIEGTWIVPEFAHLLLIMLLITSLIAVILTRTSTKKKWTKRQWQT